VTAILKPLQNNDEALTPFRAAVAEIYSDRVERIMLFGSRTHGGTKPDFDYDIAVFRTAEAYIFEQIGKVAKTDVACVVKFTCLSRAEPRIGCMGFHSPSSLCESTRTSSGLSLISPPFACSRSATCSAYMAHSSCPSLL
jgi:predicted nucleotidyltransferase